MIFYMLVARGRLPGLSTRALGVQWVRPDADAPVPGTRPEGPLVWMHVSSAEAAMPLVNVTQMMDDDRPGLKFLISTTDPEVRTLPFEADVRVELVPDDTAAAVRAFLDRWRPDVALWVGLHLRPALIRETGLRRIPLIGADGPRDRTRRFPWRFWPGLRQETLAYFEKIFVGDALRYEARLKMGARSWTVEELGFLEPNVELPPCDEDARDELASVIGVRPVWLAMQVADGEEEIVLDAFKTVLRRAHRLALILCPDDPAQTGRIAGLALERGLSVSRRSEGALPQDCQVILADVAGEEGLWYRMASVSFLGKSLTGGGGISPLVAAGLGSAIVHGPHVQSHKGAYGLLQSVDASMIVLDAAGLAQAVEMLQAPDRVASMAHAAWTVSSLGSAVHERVSRVLLDALDRKGAR